MSMRSHSFGGAFSIALFAAVTCGGCGLLLGLDEFEDTEATTGTGPGGGGQRTCEPESIETCPYGGPPERVGIGNCKAATRQCLSDGDSWSACAGEIQPRDEDCNERGDEDCDGISCSDAIWSRSYSIPRGSIKHIAIDQEGKTIISGLFAGTISIGEKTLESNTSNEFDYFIAKVDKEGTTEWIKHIEGIGDNGYNIDVAVDDNNNILAVGELSGTISIDSISLEGPALYRGTSIFIASLAPDGKHRWSKAFRFEEGEAELAAPAIVIDYNNTAIVSGPFAGTANFGGPSIESTEWDIFLTGLSTIDGSHRWTQQITDTPGETSTHHKQLISDITVTKNNRLVITGSFDDSIRFPGGMYDIGRDIASPGTHGFVASLSSSNGTIQWSKELAGCNNVAVDTDPEGNILITGGLTTETDFGGGSKLSPSGESDIFIAKYDEDDDHHWSKRFGEFNTNEGLAVVADSSGNVVVAGTLASNVDFGGGVRRAEPPADLFLLKMNKGGTHVWSKTFEDCHIQQFAESPLAYALAKHPSEDIVALTARCTNVDFGNRPLESGSVVVHITP
ncbi:hypothetical protein WME75_05220 [Sorangium sp. So ce1014]|uniref:hypothetical protein n=1 Tax=Sorangium sp. So ce1014 TaxID=3133326 RepID=UPI003F632030